MLSAQGPTTSTATTSGETRHHDHRDHDENEHIRDIHALTPPHPPPVPRGRWETGSHQSNSTSMSSEGALSENFNTMSREFNALVVAGSAVGSKINPLAIVPDNNPLDPDPSSSSTTVGNHQLGGGEAEVSSVQRVKKEEVETKISAWQNAKIAKINNRFKREDAIINGWEGEQVQKATSWMKKVERKLEEKRARALEKMQNEVAKAHRKAEDRRASAEAKRGTKWLEFLK
ncbi:hypothetical protein GH714_036033 [Hevea brasiliensis]|uniref:Remorin C-terminal domain-containing protein n=1 Tax=Hevea brasiliensis TaxID=3981 RepID=A0A6A6KM82_HEVBR|nr:hypothetical protein GH714_036033 [Hevea brasiliensis]